MLSPGGGGLGGEESIQVMGVMSLEICSRPPREHDKGIERTEIRTQKNKLPLCSGVTSMCLRRSRQ